MGQAGEHCPGEWSEQTERPSGPLKSEETWAVRAGGFIGAGHWMGPLDRATGRGGGAPCCLLPPGQPPPISVFVPVSTYGLHQWHPPGRCKQWPRSALSCCCDRRELRLLLTVHCTAITDIGLCLGEQSQQYASRNPYLPQNRRHTFRKSWLERWRRPLEDWLDKITPRSWQTSGRAREWEVLTGK